MIRPLELQAAFQAIPEQAARVNQEQAAIVYRQIQEFTRARSDSLQKPVQAQPAARRDDAAFQMVTNPGEEPPRRGELREQARRRFDEIRKEGRTYGPGGMIRSRFAVLEDELGLALDFLG
ncbi:MAG: hypothetical protein K1X75_09045 [Leptospirales bacterium]|nr:hypothetical protein [Leptospirales bacterium]